MSLVCIPQYNSATHLMARHHGRWVVRWWTGPAMYRALHCMALHVYAMLICHIKKDVRRGVQNCLPTFPLSIVVHVIARLLRQPDQYCHYVAGPLGSSSQRSVLWVGFALFSADATLQNTGKPRGSLSVCSRRGAVLLTRLPTSAYMWVS